MVYAPAPEHESAMRVLRPAWVAAVAGIDEPSDEPLPQTPPMSSLHTAAVARSALYWATSTS